MKHSPRDNAKLLGLNAPSVRLTGTHFQKADLLLARFDSQIKGTDNMKYLAVVEQAESGAFSGYFPQVKGCYFSGNTLAEARKDAVSAIAAHLGYGRDNIDRKCEVAAFVPETQGCCFIIEQEEAELVSWVNDPPVGHELL